MSTRLIATRDSSLIRLTRCISPLEIYTPPDETVVRRLMRARVSGKCVMRCHETELILTEGVRLDRATENFPKTGCRKRGDSKPKPKPKTGVAGGMGWGRSGKRMLSIRNCGRALCGRAGQPWRDQGCDRVRVAGERAGGL